MITIHWNIIVFAAVTILFFLIMGRINRHATGDFDVGTPFFGCITTLLYMLFVSIWGSIFWW